MTNVNQDMEILRIFTCGSVDDGKSTLIARLLLDGGHVPLDQVPQLSERSEAAGDADAGGELAHLLDGLQAEREQGITIDVAYRYFATPRRRFIVADTPGHEQYTRNMVTGASNCDLAIVLVDARRGIVRQTRRHSVVLKLLQIRHVVLAVNKMDLVGYARDVFTEISSSYRDFAARLGLPEVVCIPISARTGENVIRRSPAMEWYASEPLLGILESVGNEDARASEPFTMPVQLVVRPENEARAYGGTIASGRLRVGDPVSVLPSRQKTKVAQILTGDGYVDACEAGRAATVFLDDDVDIARGDALVALDAPTKASDQFRAEIVWFSEAPMLPGRRYLFKCGTKMLTGSISRLKHKLDVDTLEETSTETLCANEIGQCNIELAEPIAFEPFARNKSMGSFIVIDRANGDTIAAGMLCFQLRRSDHLFPQPLDVTRRSREMLLGQRACCIWFTGLSGSGKSTIANLLEQRLHRAGRATYILDGDNVRRGLNRDLGFKDADRVENIRRVAEVAKLMVDAGLVVLVSFISPFRAERELARGLFEPGQFHEIHVDTPLEVCEARDPKGLYAKARSGRLPGFTGIDSAYEPPVAPDLRLDAANLSPEELAEEVFHRLA